MQECQKGCLSIRFEKNESRCHASGGGKSLTLRYTLFGATLCQAPNSCHGPQGGDTAWQTSNHELRTLIRWWKGHCKSCPEDLAPVWKACIIGLRLPLGGRRSRVAKGASGMFSCQSNEWAKTSHATWKRIRFDPTKILKSGPATMEASSSTFSIPMTKVQ